MRWVDALAGGFAIGNNASFNPPAFTTNGWEYTQDDRAFYSVQTPHTIANTNSSFPNCWVEPHIHVTAASPVTNQWEFGYQFATVFGEYSAYTLLTNSVVITNANQHALLSFGNITNNTLAGKASVIFKGHIKRLDAVVIPVIVDSLDIHIPIKNIGSSGQYSGGD